MKLFAWVGGRGTRSCSGSSERPTCRTRSRSAPLGDDRADRGTGAGRLVVAFAGTGVAFAVNSASYVAVVVALLAMRVADLRPYVPPSVQTGFRRSIRVMLSFVRRSRRVAVAFFAVLALSTLSFNFDVLLPLLAGKTLDAGADVFGLMAAVFEAGALCGALFLATLGKARLRLLLAGAAGFGVVELALAMQDDLAPICGLLFLAGVFYILWGANALASLQLSAPEHLRGQAASLYMSRSWAALRSAACSPAGSRRRAARSSRSPSPARPRCSSRSPVSQPSPSESKEISMQATHDYTHCRFGVATRDITPPVGIYARSWGAATHEVAEGVHRPFTATAAVFAPIAGDEPTLALVAVDIGWFQHLSDERDLRATVMRDTGLAEEALLINMSHTHAGANVNSQLTDKPGGELIQPYIEHLTEQISAAILEAQAAPAPAWVTWGTGRCALAANRDFWDAEAERFACGYNPDAPADDTLLVARVTGEDGELRATLFNYACHPTTLAWRTGSCRPTTSARHARSWTAPSAYRHCSSRAPRAIWSARRLRRRDGRRRSQRPPARLRRRGGDRGPAAAGNQVRLQGHRRVGRQPRRLGIPAVEDEQLRGSEQLAARVSHRPAPPQGGDRRRREPLRRDSRLGAGAGEGTASPLPRRGAGRRSGLRDAALDLAARRRAARGGPQRALLGVPGRAAAAPRRDAPARPRRTNRTLRLPVAGGDLRHRASTRSSSRPSRPAVSSRRSRLPRARSRSCAPIRLAPPVRLSIARAPAASALTKGTHPR